MGLEPTPSGVTGRRYNQLNYDPKKSLKTIFTFFPGRRDRARTCDIHGVSVALFQLSYPPNAPKKLCASSNIVFACQAIKFKKGGYPTTCSFSSLRISSSVCPSVRRISKVCIPGNGGGMFFPVSNSEKMAGNARNCVSS